LTVRAPDGLGYIERMAPGGGWMVGLSCRVSSPLILKTQCLTRRKFGRRTQRRPSKKSERPEESDAELEQDIPRNGRKGAEFTKGLCPLRFSYELLEF
jgi:hypothetical protein